MNHSRFSFASRGLIVFLLLILTPAVFAASGAIWTTQDNCGDPQNINHYPIGAHVYINGDGFEPFEELPWTITGQPGGASCDPNTIVAQGTATADDEGKFCFDAYTIQEDDCGEYQVKVSDVKGDNYRVEKSVDEPSIEIIKYTNDEDANSPTGPYVPVGDTVTWDYYVTNNGNEDIKNVVVVDDNGTPGDINDDFSPTLIDKLGDNDSTLEPGETWLYRAEGTAEQGQYGNVATVTGTYGKGQDEQEISDDDPSHYFGVNAQIDIEKYTNGQDADEAPGPNIFVGDPVEWTYVITNTGNVALTNVSVVDDQGVTVTCAKTELQPGESMTCTASGTAVEGLYKNIGSVTGEYKGSTATDEDPSHYTGVVESQPSIDIEKYTNGQDADEAPGPYIYVGDPVEWTYVVTNTGNVALTDISVSDDQGVTVTCAKTELLPGESMTCTGSGTAVEGLYKNIGSVTAKWEQGQVSDEDPSHYTGTIEPKPSIDIEKYTNGEDADEAPGPHIYIGDPVQWTYVVTNTGNVTLSNIEVVDDQGVTVTCSKDELDPGESMTCTASGTAIEGLYKNIGTVTGWYEQEKLTDQDPSHYTGICEPKPQIDIEKFTNDEDADFAPGVMIKVGETVTWTYYVTTTANVPISNVVVTDNNGTPSDPLDDFHPVYKSGDDGDGLLEAGETWIYEAEGTAVEGQYCNLGMVTGTFEQTKVGDQDPSHYFGANPQIDIEKHTNGADADEAPGPFIYIGGAVEWSYIVTNTGNVPLTDIEVVDDQGVEVSCSKTELDPGESMTCTGSGVAKAGQYKNIGTVTGLWIEEKVTDEDPSHYTGTEKPCPSIDIEKYTNGENADEAPGPIIQEGQPVLWTYVVTNTGNVKLTNIVVTDNQGVVVTCPKTELEPGESMTGTGNGVAIIGQYANIGTVVALYERTEVTDSDPSHYVGEKLQETEPDDFVVAIQFKDKDGKAVGNVLCYLMIQGMQDWKVLSSWDMKLLWNTYPYNALFRGLFDQPGGTYQFKFYAPTGWQFVGADHMELEVPAHEHFYSTVGHEFLLEKTAGATSGSTVNPENKSNLESALPATQLIFMQGSATAPKEGWDNAVDGDLTGWDGTTTSRGDANLQDPSWAIFRFPETLVQKFDVISIITDNGPDDDAYQVRQVPKIDVYASTTGLEDKDFQLVKKIRVKSAEKTEVNLGYLVEAKYVKLVIPTTYASLGWRQLVEFSVKNSGKNGEALPKSDSASAVPVEFKLAQNYPNPFNPVTHIQYALAQDGPVTLAIYDVTGRVVTELVNEKQNAGEYEITWNAENVASGLYFYRIVAGSFRETRRMLLIR